MQSSCRSLPRVSVDAAVPCARRIFARDRFGDHRGRLDRPLIFGDAVDFDLPQDLVDYLAELDDFIEAKIKPLQAQDDNERFFDHRREHARTDWDNQGLPRKEWEELLAKARKLADDAGHLRYAWPPEMGGKGGTQLAKNRRTQ